MLHERYGVDENKQFILRVEDDAEQLLLLRPDEEEPFARIEFDYLVEDKFKIALADAFSEHSYRNPYVYLRQLEPSTLALSHLAQLKTYDFTVEDALFAKSVENYGIPLTLATRIAFYSRYLDQFEPSKDREDHLQHFMKQQHGVRLENHGQLRGFTTLDLYLVLAARNSIQIADHITKKCSGVPESMAASANALGVLMREKVAVENFPLSRLDTLTTLVSSEFPVDYNDGRRAVIVNTIAEFINQEHDFTLAARVLRKSEKLTLELSYELLHFIDINDAGITKSTLANGNKNTRALASIFIATYGTELIEKALNGFSKHKRVLNQHSPYMLAAFIAYVQHLQTEGDPKTPIHWIITLDPNIDESSIINRGQDNEDE